MNKTIKELFPHLTARQRVQVGNKASLFGITRDGEKKTEDGFKVCKYKEEDFRSLEEICKVIESLDYGK